MGKRNKNKNKDGAKAGTSKPQATESKKGGTNEKVRDEAKNQDKKDSSSTNNQQRRATEQGSRGKPANEKSSKPSVNDPK